MKNPASIISIGHRHAPPVLRPDPVFIVGMHRSGTSALAGALESLGLNIGKSVMPPNQDKGNPKGYYENLALVRLHDRFLAEIKCGWLAPKPIRLKKFLGPAVRRYRKELLQFLADEFGSTRPLIKDPRLCELMPLWRPLIKKHFSQAAFIIPVRSPMEVACSLRKRDNFTLSHGLILWAVHVLEAERGTRGFKRFFTTYEKLLSSPLEIVAGLAESIGLPTAEVAAAVNHQIDPSLRHHAEVSWPADEPDRETILAIYDTLAAAPPSMEAKLDRLRRRYYREKRFRLWF